MKIEYNRLCQCGCNKPVSKRGNLYILGHSNGLRNMPIDEKVFEEITGVTLAEWNRASKEYGRFK